MSCILCNIHVLLPEINKPPETKNSAFRRMLQQQQVETEYWSSEPPTIFWGVTVWVIDVLDIAAFVVVEIPEGTAVWAVKNPCRNPKKKTSQGRSRIKTVYAPMIYLAYNLSLGARFSSMVTLLSGYDSLHNLKQKVLHKAFQSQSVTRASIERVHQRSCLIPHPHPNLQTTHSNHHLPDQVNVCVVDGDNANECQYEVETAQGK